MRKIFHWTDIPSGLLMVAGIWILFAAENVALTFAGFMMFMVGLFLLGVINRG